MLQQLTIDEPIRISIDVIESIHNKGLDVLYVGFRQSVVPSDPFPRPALYMGVDYNYEDNISYKLDTPAFWDTNK